MDSSNESSTVDKLIIVGLLAVSITMITWLPNWIVASGHPTIGLLVRLLGWGMLGMAVVIKFSQGDGPYKAALALPALVSLFYVGILLLRRFLDLIFEP